METLRLLQQRTLRQALQQLRQPTALQQSLRQLSQRSAQQPSFRTKPRTVLSKPSVTAPSFPRARSFRSADNILSRIRTRTRGSGSGGRRFQSSTSTTSDANLSLSQRLRKLSREYGWSAVGVYLLLSALDFPFCFLGVRVLGTDRIGHWEHVVLSYVKSVMKWPLGPEGQQDIEEASQVAEGVVKETVPELRGTAVAAGAGAGAETGTKRILEEEEASDTVATTRSAEKVDGNRVLDVDGESFAADKVEDHGYREAEQANRGENASIWTQLALAYAIHKSFIFIRVPLTAAVTPKVVKTLRSWGWNIGKMPKKKTSVSETTGINTRGTGVKSD